MVRLLHTADWHLGRTLEGRSRMEEQYQFVDELCRIADDRGVNLVVIAGDVFDTYNPSAAAEELFYDALERLSDGGRRAVVAIAGNHDNPSRLRAANPLALRHGVTLVGYPTETLEPGGSPPGVCRRACGAGWVELDIPGVDENVVIATIAYPSERRLNELLAEHIDDEAVLQREYSERIRVCLAEVAAHFRPDTVNVIMSHLFVRGGLEAESERSLGGALGVDPSAFPENADYVALGHLHRSQSVGGAAVPTRYSGSPLSYSFSEADQQKEVILVDVEPGAPARLERIPLSCGRPLKRWEANSLQEVHEWCEEEANRQAWVELTLHLSEPLTASQTAELRRRHQGLVNIRVLLPELESDEDEVRLSSLTLEEQFRRFATRERGAPPDDELVALFLELAGGASVDDIMAGDPTAGTATGEEVADETA